MIQYRISYQELAEKIEAEKPGWMARAETKTVEDSSIWSEVKVVYMRLQGGSKCAYCERKMESEEFGKGEQAVDHFRPKKRVKVWKAPQNLIDEGIVFTVPPKDNKGYPALCYHLFNYAAACNPCNSILKKDYFPIAGTYQIGSDGTETLHRTELPYLIYPIGDFHARPESFIEFRGLSPRPVHEEGYERNRALVTIEFFRLDDMARKNLFIERAEVIAILYPRLEKLNASMSESEKQVASRIVTAYTSGTYRHTNCARNFKRLYETDKTEAKRVHDRAEEFLATKPP